MRETSSLFRCCLGVLLIAGDVLRTRRHMAVEKPPTTEIADLQSRLAELDRERESVLTALEQLKLRGEPELQAASMVVIWRLERGVK